MKSLWATCLFLGTFRFANQDSKTSTHIKRVTKRLQFSHPFKVALFSSPGSLAFCALTQKTEATLQALKNSQHHKHNHNCDHEGKSRANMHKDNEQKILTHASPPIHGQSDQPTMQTSKETGMPLICHANYPACEPASKQTVQVRTKKPNQTCKQTKQEGGLWSFFPQHALCWLTAIHKHQQSCIHGIQIVTVLHVLPASNHFAQSIHSLLENVHLQALERSCGLDKH